MGMVVSLISVSCAWAGDVNPPGAPGPTMHSLEELYQQLLLAKQQIASNQQTIATLSSGVTTTQTGQDAVATMVANFASSQGSTVSNIWQSSIVDGTGSVGHHNSLAFTPAGRPAISYRDLANNDLKYAVFDGSAWTVQTVDSASDVRDFTSLAFTPAGRPAIAYYDQTAYDLKYAEYNGSTWTLQTVDSVDVVGTYASLAFTSDGRPAISYYDAGNADLKYAEWSGSAWVKTTVDGTGTTVGFYTSLAFTPAGRPAISYFGGNPNNDLKYAEYNGSAWIVTTVDAEGNTGYYTSLAFTPAGRPAISYYDNTGVRVLYTEYNGSAWVRSIVQTGTSTGFCTSLAFTPAGRPAIAYTDYPNRDLVYAEFDGVQWALRTLDSAGEVGLYVSLAFSPEGRPAVSYFDDTNDDLKFITVAGVTVSSQVSTTQTRLAAVSNQVSATQVQVSSVGTQVASVSNQVSSVGTQVSSVGTQVGSLQSQLSGVSNQVLEVKGLIQTVDLKLATLTNQISSIEQRLMAGGILQPSSGAMVLIPAGRFVVGTCTNAGLEYIDDSVPQHTVFVSAFYMDKYEVTSNLWSDVYAWATERGYSFNHVGVSKGATHPIHTIHWYDCVKWCNARSEREGLTPAYTVSGAVYRAGMLVPECDFKATGYRLPTEAEWEKAARGGSFNRRFPWGDTIQQTRANYDANPAAYSYDTNPTAGHHPAYMTGGAPYTSPVGSFAPNGYGLYDMSGNVKEWCWDWYSDYALSLENDPAGPAYGWEDRVVRGGSWNDTARDARVAFRNVYSDYSIFDFLGFRCVRGH